MQDDPEQLYRPEEAAQILGLKPRTLIKWRQTGEGPQVIRLSLRAVRYRRRDLLRWIEAHTEGTSSGDTA